MITPAIVVSAKLGWFNGVHTPTDVYRIALYDSSANLDVTTTTYTSGGEIAATGYTTGGEVLSGFNTAIDGETAILTFSDPVWNAATITAAGALIYNSSKSGAAIAVISFGGDITSTNGTFRIQFPAFAAATAFIKFV